VINSNNGRILAEPRFEWGRLHWALKAVFTYCQPNDRVLDVGCGKGWLVDAFGRARLAACGIDVDSQAIDDSMALCPSAEILSFDGVQIPYSEARFDFVTLIEVLEHVADEAVILAEIHRVLVPGGFLVLTTPNAGPWEWLDPDNFKFRAPWAHKFLYHLLGRSEEYQRRFSDQGGLLVGNFTKRADGSAIWHHHYTKEQVEVLAVGFETVDCRLEGGFLFTIMLIANYISEKMFGTWLEPFTALMKWDAQKDRRERGWALQMILRRKN
jgi:SAM-dependent methyltransferase